MSIVAFIDCVKLVDDAGFPAGTSQLDGVCIIAAESGRNPDAKHVNTDGSIDRGLWQINDKAHPDVTDAMAYDPVQATAAAFTISKGGTDYSAWSTFTNDAYRAHLEAGKVALDGWLRAKRAAAALATLQAKIDAAKAALT